MQELYDNLLSPDASTQLNVDAYILHNVEAELAKSNKSIELRHLETLKAQVIRMIYENTFRGFVGECRFQPRKRRFSMLSSSRRRRLSNASSMSHSSQKAPSMV